MVIKTGDHVLTATEKLSYIECFIALKASEAGRKSLTATSLFSFFLSESHVSRRKQINGKKWLGFDQLCIMHQRTSHQKESKHKTFRIGKKRGKRRT